MVQAHRIVNVYLSAARAQREANSERQAWFTPAQGRGKKFG